MIQLTPQMKILLAIEPADFRKGIDGLAQLCRQRLRVDPQSGTMFVFSNKRRKALKILVCDGQGFWLCQKRLSQGRFTWWPQSPAAVDARMRRWEFTVLGLRAWLQRSVSKLAESVKALSLDPFRSERKLLAEAQRRYQSQVLTMSETLRAPFHAETSSQ